MLGAMHEFFNMSKSIGIIPSRVVSYFGGLTIFATTSLSSSGILSEKYLLLLIPVFIIISACELFRNKQKPIENIAGSALSLIYVAIPFSMTSMLAFPVRGEYTPNILIALFAIIWIYDSGAYLFGVSFGKNRLFERISPKKSWEGAIGGLLSTLIATYFLSDFVPEISTMNWMIISTIIAFFATLGDLTESMIKRQVDVKDSGNFFPGHGGILDRFVSMLFAVPVLVFYIKFFL